MGQAERAFSAMSTFLSGIMAISASQFIGAPLRFIDAKFYESYMAWTKESFAVLMTTITQWWAPTIVRVSGDESMKGQLFQMDDGSLRCNFPHRLVLMGNHQLYTDWLYLWWIAYTNKMHGRIYIILKESLKQLPIIGWGMQFYNFIFLSRKWEYDKARFKSQLSQLKNPADPMWLLIFPEGTNLSAVTREKSAAWSKKSGVPDMKHQLLPRSTGLQFCLRELHHSTNWLYDCTIAYEGIPKGQYGQDVYTLRSSFVEGRPPKSVNMFWRRFRISEIPFENDDAFGRWLLNRWREKDYMLEYFYKYGSFPAAGPANAMAAVRGQAEHKHAKAITASLKGGGWDEFLSIFGPITTAAGTLSSIDLTEPLNLNELMSKVAKSQQLDKIGLSDGSMPDGSQEFVKKALLAAHKSRPLPPPILKFLLGAIPQTQAEMASSLQHAGDPNIARRASNAPAQNVALPKKLQSDINLAAQHAREAVAKIPSDKRSSKATSSANITRKVPLANMESLITRPMSTIGVHKATAQVQKLALQKATPVGLATGKKSSDLSRAATISQLDSVDPAVKKPKEPFHESAGLKVDNSRKNLLSTGKAASTTGRQTLKRTGKSQPRINVNVGQRSSKTTIKALSEGSSDYPAKPTRAANHLS